MSAPVAPPPARDAQLDEIIEHLRAIREALESATRPISAKAE